MRRTASDPASVLMTPAALHLDWEEELARRALLAAHDVTGSWVAGDVVGSLGVAGSVAPLATLVAYHFTMRSVKNVSFVADTAAGTAYRALVMQRVSCAKLAKPWLEPGIAARHETAQAAAVRRRRCSRGQLHRTILRLPPFRWPEAWCTGGLGCVPRVLGAVVCAGRLGRRCRSCCRHGRRGRRGTAAGAAAAPRRAGGVRHPGRPHASWRGCRGRRRCRVAHDGARAGA